jgi:uncharacterized membrane protein (UPF0127 family)
MKDPVTIPIIIEGHRLHAELAMDFEARARGLMGRTDLAPDGALLLCQPHLAPMQLWMSNTPISLSVAFLSGQKTISHFADMTPFDATHIHYSSAPVLYALETHRGWFEKRGIVVGTQIFFNLPLGMRPT